MSCRQPMTYALVASCMLAACASPTGESACDDAATRAAAAQMAPDSVWVVFFARDAVPDIQARSEELTARYDGTLHGVWNALQGFSAVFAPSAICPLRREPDVVLVGPQPDLQFGRRDVVVPEPPSWGFVTRRTSTARTSHPWRPERCADRSA